MLVIALNPPDVFDMDFLAGLKNLHNELIEKVPHLEDSSDNRQRYAVTTCVLSLGFFTFMLANMNNLICFEKLTGITIIVSVHGFNGSEPALASSSQSLRLGERD